MAPHWQPPANRGLVPVMVAPLADRRLEHGQRITACKNELVDAGGIQCGFLLAWAACQIDMLAPAA